MRDLKAHDNVIRLRYDPSILFLEARALPFGTFFNFLFTVITLRMLIGALK